MDGRSTRFHAYSKSCAVTGLPSDHRASGRRWNRKIRWSSLRSQRVATPCTGRRSPAPYVVSPSNSCCTSVELAESLDFPGSKYSGSPPLLM
ncbi:hypothetical protein [Sorangium sp. So ce1000]|uniref:hypothetical protein n=1 Tax=Sorangium sp. So ce1000 TaxID=3133325 RepID=UPI003F62C8D7